MGREAGSGRGMTRVLSVLVAIWVAWGAVAQEEVRLTPEQAVALAEQAVMAGDIRAADSLSSLVLAGDPENARALLVRAVVAREVGALDEAAEIGAEAYRAAEDRTVRFEAAFLVADVRARQERYTTSQFWLRRADQAAPDARRRELAANAYRQVTRLNPLSLQLRFTAQPSNNVNNGASVETTRFGGLPIDFNVPVEDQQLGGYEASAGLSFGYRLSQDERQRTDLLGEIFYRKIWLDSAAKEKAPGVTGSDFDYGAVVTGLRHSRLIWPDLGVSRVTALIGQNWYGGEALSRWGEVRLTQDVTQGEEALLTFGLALRRDKQLERASTTNDDTINSSRSVELSVDRVQLVDGRRLSYGLAAKNWWSDSGTVDSASVTVRGSLELGEVWGVQPTLSGSLEQRVFHKFTAAVDGRRDTSASLGVTATVPDYAFYGFIPQVSLQLRRTWSTFDLYDRNSYSLGLTAVSRF